MMDVPAEKREQGLILTLIDKYQLASQPFIEIGCGDGYNLRVFQKKGMTGIGIDASAEAIQKAKEKNLPGIRLVHADATKVSLKKSGILFLLNVLEHVEHDGEFLKKIHKLLKREGYLFLAVPAHSKAYGYADKNAGHYRRYDKQQLCHLLQETGFQVEEMFSVGFPVCNFYTWVFNTYCKFRGDNQFDQKKTYVSGIEGQPGYYPPVFQIASKVLFPIFSILIKIDALFLKTDLGNNYVVMARKD